MTQPGIRSNKFSSSFATETQIGLTGPLCKSRFVGVLLLCGCFVAVLSGCSRSETAPSAAEQRTDVSADVEAPEAPAGDDREERSPPPADMSVERSGNGVADNTGGAPPEGLTRPDNGATVADPGASGDQEKTPEEILGYEPYAEKSPAELAAEKAFAAPAGATKLLPDANLWVDRDQHRLIVDGYVALREGPLEMFACPAGTKEHESVVAVLSQAKYVHAGLLALDAIVGTPVSFLPEYRPATGQRIAIWVLWRDAEGRPQKVRAQAWIQEAESGNELSQDWVFAGSSFWKDPQSGQEFYQADSGDLVCVSNFSTATLDLPVASSDSNGSLLYAAYTERIPERGTPVRLVFVPIPIPGGQESQGADPAQAPEDQLVAAPAAAQE